MAVMSLQSCTHFSFVHPHVLSPYTQSFQSHLENLRNVSKLCPDSFLLSSRRGRGGSSDRDRDSREEGRPDVRR